MKKILYFALLLFLMSASVFAQDWGSSHHIMMHVPSTPGESYQHFWVELFVDMKAHPKGDELLFCAFSCFDGRDFSLYAKDIALSQGTWYVAVNLKNIKAERQVMRLTDDQAKEYREYFSERWEKPDKEPENLGQKSVNRLRDH